MKAKERGVDCEDLTLAVGGSAGLELMSQSETTLGGHHQADEDTLNDDLVRSAKETLVHKPLRIETLHLSIPRNTMISVTAGHGKVR
jgi:hypothetical protein